MDKWVMICACLFTIHDFIHILDETMNHFENLRCGSMGLILGETIYSLQHCPDVVFSKQFFCRIFCVGLSKVATIQWEWTYEFVLA